ncbi:hypothetical protein [Kitasatospora sp. NPDC058218]|uniref:hypothetical protein n=1 Tax=Kitasatospora sp. NPDC058218 TaxID=3346385 RepID=UPI0036D9EA65
MTTFEGSLAAEAERLEREYADHDTEAFTRRLAQRIAEENTNPTPEPDWATRTEPPAARPAPLRPPRPPRPTRRSLRRRRRRVVLRGVVQPGLLPGRPRASADLVGELNRLCEDVLRSDQITTLADFADDYDDAGARTFACLLYALDRTDSALYWWGFAAGAGDGLAAHCLAVHHAALGTPTDARVWRTYARLVGFNPNHHLPRPVRAGTEPARNLAVTVTHNSQLEQFLAEPEGLPQELALR